MEPRQVFSLYDWSGNSGTDSLRYCPRCGSECHIKKEAGRERPVCPECGFVHYGNPSPGVDVLIEENGKVLLGRRGPGSFREGKWCLPCGFMEFDEDFLTAAHREVKEETGLEIRISSLLSVVTNYLTPHLHTLVVVLLAHPVGGTLRAGDDIDTVEWFLLAGPLPEIAFEADRHIIERYSETRLQGVPVDPDYATL
jgi:ADP-ribose pyrophosphatase YjhB (NUDIX family)